MTLALACIAWVFAATAVAMLPMRLQTVPGIILLIIAPMLIIWVASVVAWWAGVLALAAFVSMFRMPLRYFWGKLRTHSCNASPELRS